jgi:hypothetical protein
MYNCNHSSPISETRSDHEAPRRARSCRLAMASRPVEIFAGKKRFGRVDDLSGRDAVQVACARALFSERGDRDNPET